MMEAVKRGADRQALHEAIRVHSMEASANVKMNGGKNDLLDRIASDPVFELDRMSLKDLLEPSLYIGRAPEQVAEYLRNDVYPVLRKNRKEIEKIIPHINI
jgi:adenylosuccinate lyase